MSERTRVVLLAREGDARAKLDAALREAGAEVALVADPVAAQPADVAAAAPQAVLVALDPGVEDVLDRWQSLLGDPGITVVFDEAEVAATREGWDAARWVRHLSAKLHRHDDVLPPGGELDEGDWQPAPGPLYQPGASTDTLDLAAYAGEAFELAADVPVGEAVGDSTAAAPALGDSLPVDDVPPPPDGLDVEEVDLDDAELAALTAAAAIAPLPPAPADLDDAPAAIDLELGDDDAAALQVLTADGGVEGLVDAAEMDWSSPTAGIEVDASLADELQALVDADDADDTDVAAAEDAHAWQPAAREDVPLFDGSFGEVAPRADEADDDASGAGADRVDAPAAAPPAVPTGDAFAFADDDAPAAAAPPPAFDPDRIAALGSSLSLADEDAPAAPAAAPARPAPARDVGDLERRASVLSLVDTNDYGHGPERGAVLVDGGLGGPDAVRQLLAGLPEAFARPVLVRLHLDGGRYDRLVKQMERASALPVALATAGAAADAATVYFLPPDIGLVRERGQLRFAAMDNGGRDPAAVLPANDSAWLMLSGGDAAAAPAAGAWLADGGLVAAQSPATCYDAAAAQALVDAGAPADDAAALAVRLRDRWPS